jgi:hypothetical protein
MTYSVEILRSAQKQLRKIDRQDQSRITDPGCYPGLINITPLGYCELHETFSWAKKSSCDLSTKAGFCTGYSTRRIHRLKGVYLSARGNTPSIPAPTKTRLLLQCSDKISPWKNPGSISGLFWPIFACQRGKWGYFGKKFGETYLNQGVERCF